MTTTTAAPNFEAAEPVIAATTSSDRRAYDATKRAIDVVGAVLLLAATSVILVAAIIAIALTTRGPVLFGHERRGRYGVPFTCWKLRTMVRDAEKVIAPDHPLARVFAEHYKLPRDPRVTPVGRFLRRTSIDELPQLWNVIRGDMSLVGPRPVTGVEYTTMYGGAAPVVFSVRPGLTGLWQTSGRSGLSYAERIALDLEYARTRSLTTDLRILLNTPRSLVRHKAH
jgi:exopolysaccharide production protein ExoY